MTPAGAPPPTGFALPPDPGTGSASSRPGIADVVQSFRNGDIHAAELCERTRQVICDPDTDAATAFASIRLAMECVLPQTGRRFLPHLSTFSAAMHKCANANMARATLWMLHVLEKQPAGHALAPRRVHYNIAIKACQRGELPNDLLKVFDAALGRLSPSGLDSFIYCAAIDACGKADGPSRHEELKQLRAEAARQCPEMGPSCAQYTRAIRALVAQGRLHEALAEVGNAYWTPLRPPTGPDTLLNVSAIEVFGAAGLAESALGMFWYLRTRNEASHHKVYEATLAACQSARRQDLADIVLRLGIGEGVLQAQLGFCAETNVLDFSRESVFALDCAGKEGTHGVDAGAALAIFEHLRQSGLVNDRTVFVVMRHCHGLLRDAIARRICELGCWPAFKRYADGVIQEGRLQARHRPLGNDWAGGPPDPQGAWALNPAAH